MVLYRCAACGSPNVVTDTQIGGIKYNYVKGAIGTVALGAGGAAAGITSETQQVFKCPDCGMTLTYSMDTEMKNLIDIGVMSADVRENLKYCGIPITWDFLKTKFKNIEEGSGDQSKSWKKSLQEQLNLDLSEDSQSMRDAMRDLYRKEYQDQLPSLIEWAKEKIHEDDAKIAAHKEEKKNKISALSEEKNELEHELPTLGLFKGARKKEISARLLAIEKELNGLSNGDDDNYKNAVLRWRGSEEISAEEMGQDSAILLYLIALYGPSVILELTHKDEIKQNKRAGNLLYWGSLANKLKDDGILVFIRQNRRGYYALADNYGTFLADGEHEINLQ